MVQRESLHFPAVGGRPMRAFLALPDDTATPRAAVIVIHEIFGLNDDIRRIASRFAEGGYVALAPDLHDTGAPRLICIARTVRSLNRGRGAAFDDLEAARGWLAARPEVDASRLGVAGFCMGGGFALLYAVRAPLRAAATFYGALPPGSESLAGVCPVLGGYGGRDRMLRNVPARLERRLTELGVPHDVKVYEDAGHSYMSQQRGFLKRISNLWPISRMGMGYQEEAAEDSWRRMLAFFGEHIGAAP